ncbi:type IV pili methyl-accepting chemotaxis transducer N-terminal domain-containing protein [Planctobacterium marinum]|uniref:NarX-like N-terminal domain-containing protein n=1 Tax=Planctobacterium marinum TaxID=1631968 RepID=A0AA48HI87_9ALTE|nr:hypothetical protein MACH26_24120 [Planctobacterium marinum]
MTTTKVLPVKLSHHFTLILLSLLVLFSTQSMASPTAAEYGTVLNLSGKQRMLSQKMSKEVMLVALEVDKAANIENLKNTAALFDKTLKGLRSGDADLGLPATSAKRILRQLDKVDAIWADFYPTIQAIVSSGSVTAEQVATIAAKNLPLLKQMNKAVGAYEKDAAKNGLSKDPGLAATLNLSGKQRMLTQKMSKEFLLVAYGHNVEENKLNLLETFTLFDRTLKGLVSGDEVLGLPGTSDATIVAQLKVVEGLWQDFKPQVSAASEAASSGVSSEQVSKIASSNLPLLKEMNKAVGMYEAQAAK